MAAQAGSPINAQEIARLLATPKGFNALYVVNKRRHALIGLFDYIGGQSKALKIDSVNGVISSMKLDNYKTRSIITSPPTLLAGQLTVTVTAGEGTNFIPNYVVADLKGNLGVIASVTANTIVLNPVNQALTTSMFATSGSNNYAVQLYNVSATQGSDKPGFKKYLPDVFQNNYLQVSRGAMTLNAAEFNATFIDGVQGAKNYQAAFMQYQVALNNFADGIEARMFNGQAAANVSLTNGTESGNTNGGLDWAIQNRGGIYDVLNAFPSTNYILDVLTQLRENTGRPNSEFVFICGPSAKAAIALALQNYKTTAGKSSVLDGAGLAVDGFNTTFGYVTLMDSWYMGDKFWNPSVSSITGTRKMSNEFYILTLDATPDFFGAEAPLVRMCYRDEPGVAGASITTSWVNGLIDKDGMRINNASTANSLDQVTVNWYTNSGIDIVDAAGLYAFKLNS